MANLANKKINGVMLITKSNALRRAVKQKDEELNFILPLKLEISHK